MDWRRDFADYCARGRAGDAAWSVFGMDDDDPEKESEFGRIVSDAEGETLCVAESRAAAELIAKAMNELHDRAEREGLFGEAARLAAQGEEGV